MKVIYDIDKDLQDKVIDLTRQLLDMLKESGIDSMFNIGINPKHDYISFFSASEDSDGCRLYKLEYSQWTDDGEFIVHIHGDE